MAADSIERYQEWENPLVAVIMGSDSDLSVMIEAPRILDKLGVPNRVDIISAHRTPQLMADFAKYAARKSFQVCIAGAGGAAHLPGMTAAFAEYFPTIGVPIMSETAKTNAAALSIQEMPPGVPVAAMAVNGAKNAGIFAAQILGISWPEFSQAVMNYRTALGMEIRDKRILMEEIGPEEYEIRRKLGTLGIRSAEEGVPRGGFLPSRH